MKCNEQALMTFLRTTLGLFGILDLVQKVVHEMQWASSDDIS